MRSSMMPGFRAFRVCCLVLLLSVMIAAPSANAQINIDRNFFERYLTSEYTTTTYGPALSVDVDFITVPQSGGVFDLRGISMQRHSSGGVQGTTSPSEIPGGDHEAFADATHGVLTRIDEEGREATTSVFYRLESDALHIVGMYTESIDDHGDEITSVILHEPSDIFMPIPTTMSTSWEYDVAQNFYMNDELSMTSELEMSHEVIGYGRLLTDYGEVDVLQVRRVERQTVFGFILEIEEYELMGPDSLVARVSVDEDGVIGDLELNVMSGFTGTSVDDLQAQLEQLRVAPNHPNPFNESTTIAYDVPTSQHVSISVFDMLGREVSTLVDHVVPAGSHRAVFDAGGHPSGIYLYRVSADGETRTGRMVLAR